MADRKWLEDERKSRAIPLVKTGTTHTLSYSDLKNFPIIVGSNASGIAFTVPAAGAAYKGITRFFCNKGAGAMTLVVAAGYGGGSNTTATLAQGDMAILTCDGSYWYQMSSITATT